MSTSPSRGEDETEAIEGDHDLTGSDGRAKDAELLDGAGVEDDEGDASAEAGSATETDGGSDEAAADLADGSSPESPVEPAGEVDEPEAEESPTEGSDDTADGSADGSAADGSAADDEEPDAPRAPEAHEDEPAEHDTGVAAADNPGRPRAKELLRASARSRAGILIGVLIGLLGFALAVQVRSNTSTNGMTSARQEDLVRILDDLSSREDRLRRQIASLEAAKARLSTTGDRSQVALAEARTRSTALGILAGTLPAQGPGIQLTINDPNGKITAEDLLDAVEELRAAGAEAIQVGGVRIGLDSSFTAAEDGLRVDGQRVDAPYTILAIGDPATLATALGIPGGVVDAARQAGGEARIVRQQQLVIRALRTLRPPQYSRPADGGR